ncbi:MAG: hypothetical protein DMF56_12615 [Acidobacteria bacterium]|nr:MAG: hypothetical protein DMF56_12615 [Acidobacteriota bacterium]
MRFTVEERHLTDTGGRPIATPLAVQFHQCAGENLDEAVRLFVRDTEGELIGDVLKFPGLQAVATVRKASGVYTLQFTPSSERNVPLR